MTQPEERKPEEAQQAEEKPERKSRTNLYIGAIIVIIIAIIGVYVYYTYLVPKPVIYTATLTGSKVVPNATGSAATGGTTFTLSADGRTMHFALTINSLTNITAAHIHLGAANQNGPVVVPLYLGPSKTGPFSGILAEGDFTASNLAGPLANQTMNDLVNDIKNGSCYVNVHTTKFPGGEIRGQIQP